MKLVDTVDLYCVVFLVLVLAHIEHINMNNEELDFSLSLYDFMILKRIYDKETLSAETILFERISGHRWSVNLNEVLSQLAGC